MREKESEEKGSGEKTGEMKGEKRGEKKTLLTLNNDTTIALCFLFSMD